MFAAELKRRDLRRRWWWRDVSIIIFIIIQSSALYNKIKWYLNPTMTQSVERTATTDGSKNHSIKKYHFSVRKIRKLSCGRSSASVLSHFTRNLRCVYCLQRNRCILHSERARKIRSTMSHPIHFSRHRSRRLFRFDSLLMRWTDLHRVWLGECRWRRRRRWHATPSIRTKNVMCTYIVCERKNRNCWKTLSISTVYATQRLIHSSWCFYWALSISLTDIYNGTQRENRRVKSKFRTKVKSYGDHLELARKWPIEGMMKQTEVHPDEMGTQRRKQNRLVINRSTFLMFHARAESEACRLVSVSSKSE